MPNFIELLDFLRMQTSHIATKVHILFQLHHGTSLKCVSIILVGLDGHPHSCGIGFKHRTAHVLPNLFLLKSYQFLLGKKYVFPGNYVTIL